MAAYLKLGKIVAVYGLNGELVLKHELGIATKLENITALFMEDKNKKNIPYFLEVVKPKTTSELYIKLEDIDTRETAMPLLAKTVWLPEKDFKRLSHQNTPANFLGYRIIDHHTELGLIKEIIEQPHQLLCSILIEDKEVLIPLHDNTIQSIDHEKKEITVSLPDGLLNIYLE